MEAVSPPSASPPLGHSAAGTARTRARPDLSGEGRWRTVLMQFAEHLTDEELRAIREQMKLGE
jgi:hypothetical protein